MPRRDTMALLLLVLVGALTGGAIALTNGTHTSGEIPLTAPSGPTVIVVDQDQIDLTNPFPASDTVDIVATGGSVTVDGADGASVTVDTIEGTFTETSSLDVIGKPITIDPGDKAAVTVSGDITSLDWRQGMAPDDATVDFRYDSSLGSGSITLNGLSASTEYAAVDSNTNDVLDVSTSDGSGAVTFSGMESGSHDVVLETSAGGPVVDDASATPDGGVSTDTPTLSVDVSDPDFPNDEVTVDWFVDGSQVHSETITSNQTVQYATGELAGGDHTWHVEVTDAYGQTGRGPDTGTFDIQIPDELRVYYETQPETLVTDPNVSATVRFFPLDGSDPVERDVQNGVVDLTGLPVGQDFVVTLRDEGNQSDSLEFRRVYVPSIFETERVFALRENESTSTIVFELLDPTGSFPPQETVLVIEKPMTINGTTKYWPITGDTFGATSRFPAVLETGSRYRLRVISDEGERIIGAYNVYGSTTETIRIQRIEPEADDREVGVVDATLTQAGGTATLTVLFRGDDPDTTVRYNVTDMNGSVVVPDTSSQSSNFAHVYDFAANGSVGFTVHYTIEYPDGSATSGEVGVGELASIADRFGIDPQVLAIISYIAILASMGLVVIVDRTLAPLVGTGVATLATILGTVTISPAFLGVAGAISVLTIFGGRR